MVMGSRNHGPLRRVLLGSLARQLMSSAPWPVIVFPRGASATAGLAAKGTGAAGDAA